MREQATETQPTEAAILAELKALRADFATLRKESAKLADGWLDAKGAAVYLGGMSQNTFDKYRYAKEGPRIEGHKLDGKTLYKREELDDFVRLYDLRQRGLV